MADQTIQVFSAGAAEFTWTTTISETTGKDISGDAVTVCLGTYTVPGLFVTPDVISRPTVSTAVVQLLVGGNGHAGTPYKPSAGTYWVWVFLPDSPEQVPRRGARIIIS
jgi:hypothetical protein